MNDLVKDDTLPSYLTAAKKILSLASKRKENQIPIKREDVEYYRKKVLSLIYCDDRIPRFLPVIPLEFPGTVVCNIPGTYASVCGTFSSPQWKPYPMDWCPYRKSFVCNLFLINHHLTAGRYKLKFIVDDVWLCERALGVIEEGSFENNIIDISVADEQFAIQMLTYYGNSLSSSPGNTEGKGDRGEKGEKGEEWGRNYRHQKPFPPVQYASIPSNPPAIPSYRFSFPKDPTYPHSSVSSPSNKWAGKDYGRDRMHSRYMGRCRLETSSLTSRHSFSIFEKVLRESNTLPLLISSLLACDEDLIAAKSAFDVNDLRSGDMTRGEKKGEEKEREDREDREERMKKNIITRRHQSDTQLAKSSEGGGGEGGFYEDDPHSVASSNSLSQGSPEKLHYFTKEGHKHSTESSADVYKLLLDSDGTNASRGEPVAVPMLSPTDATVHPLASSSLDSSLPYHSLDNSVAGRVMSLAASGDLAGGINAGRCVGLGELREGDWETRADVFCPEKSSIHMDSPASPVTPFSPYTPNNLSTGEQTEGEAAVVTTKKAVDAVSPGLKGGGGESEGKDKEKKGEEEVKREESRGTVVNREVSRGTELEREGNEKVQEGRGKSTTSDIYPHEDIAISFHQGDATETSGLMYDMPEISDISPPITTTFEHHPRSHSLAFIPSTIPERKTVCRSQSIAHPINLIQDRKRWTKNLSLRFGTHMIPHPDKVKHGGADACFFNPSTNTFGVADGVGEWDSYDVNPRSFAVDLMRASYYASMFLPPDNEPERKAKRILSFAFAHTWCIGSSTAIICCLNDKKTTLGIAALGDSSVMIFRRKHQYLMNCISQSREQQHSFNCPYQLSRLPSKKDFPKHIAEGRCKLIQACERSKENSQQEDLPKHAQTFQCKLYEGDLVISCTDGVLDNLSIADLQNICNRTISPYDAFLMGDESKITCASHIAAAIARRAYEVSVDVTAKVPFGRNARAAFRTGDLPGGHFKGADFVGGKPDDITVVCAWVVREGSSYLNSSVPYENALLNTCPKLQIEKELFVKNTSYEEGRVGRGELDVPKGLCVSSKGGILVAPSMLGPGEGKWGIPLKLNLEENLCIDTNKNDVAEIEGEGCSCEQYVTEQTKRTNQRNTLKRFKIMRHENEEIWSGDEAFSSL